MRKAVTLIFIGGSFMAKALVLASVFCVFTSVQVLADQIDYHCTSSWYYTKHQLNGKEVQLEVAQGTMKLGETKTISFRKGSAIQLVMGLAGAGPRVNGFKFHVDLPKSVRFQHAIVVFGTLGPDRYPVIMGSGEFAIWPPTEGYIGFEREFTPGLPGYASYAFEGAENGAKFTGMLTCSLDYKN